MDLSFVMRPIIDHHEACLPTAAASDESSLHTSTTQKPLHRQSMSANQCWAHLLEEGGLRDIEVESVTKMLACGTSILGVKHYTCGNDSCWGPGSNGTANRLKEPQDSPELTVICSIRCPKEDRSTDAE
ncbi:IS801, transposase [Pseudomonas syringae pv. actinidiae ICMP 19104]|nr:IS801, transposase [Pseudomonas syringae pv. actinidiae ICMP 19104]